METVDPTVQIKKLVVEQEIATWRNTLYQAKVRHRVQEQIGASPETLKGCEREVERAIKALDVCQEILAEVEAETTAANGKEIDHAGHKH